jgi:hypothetical protein
MDAVAASDDAGRVALLFVASRDDDTELIALDTAGAAFAVIPDSKSASGQWARKINWAFPRFVIGGGYDFALFGADDLDPHRGWFEACIEVYEKTEACVVGTNDLGNSRVMAGQHSTHPLVHRNYLDCGTIDEEGLLLHEGYGHWFVDDEFVQTARARGVYAHAHNARVEHLHPNWNKATDDATYRKGQASIQEDRLHYESRKRLWLRR